MITGILIAVPIPEEFSIGMHELNDTIARAIDRARSELNKPANLA